MEPEQLTELFESMATTIRETSRGRGDDGVPRHTREAPPPPPPKVDLSRDKLKEFFDPTSEKFDPESAILAIAQKNYAPLLGDINTRSINAHYAQFRAELPDFEALEPEIKNQIKVSIGSGRDPATITERDILNLYFHQKGLKQTLKEKQDRKSRSTTTLPPTPAGDGGKKATKDLSPLEEEVARRMFRKAKDPIAEYKKFAAIDEEQSGITVNVPLGGGKKG